MKGLFRKKEAWEKRTKFPIPWTRGRILCLSVAVILFANAVLSHIALFSFGSLFMLILGLGIAVAYYRGVKWLRYIVTFFTLFTLVGWVSFVQAIYGSGEQPFPFFLHSVNINLPWAVELLESLTQGENTAAARSCGFYILVAMIIFAAYLIYVTFVDKSAAKFLAEQKERLKLMT
jgi:energy-coupling factor transporter transmembrane protein EcfT